MPENDLPPSRDYDISNRDVADAGLFSDSPPDLGASGVSLTSLYDAAVIHARAMTADNTDNRWIARGPRNIGGRIRALVQDPATPQRFFAGSAFGGLWRTEDSGETWTSVDVSFAPGAVAATHVEATLPVGAIGVCHRDPQQIYVGSGEPSANKPSGTGIYYSDDGGAHFARLVQPGDAHYSERYERIIVDPWDGRRCWAASPTGLFRRQPGSGDFTEDSILGVTVPPIDREDITDIAIDFGSKNRAALPAGARYTIYVGMRARRQSHDPANPNFDKLHAGGIFRASFDPATDSYDGGWTRLTSPSFPFPVVPAGHSMTNAADIRDIAWKLQLTQRIKISICENHPETLYMVVGLDDQRFSAVLRSDDGGNIWRSTATRPDDTNKQSFHCLFVSAHPDDPNICMTGCLDIWRTVSGGDSWDKVLDWNNFRKGDRAQHADQHILIYDQRDPRRVWLANDHGISESRNLGIDWRTRSFGIQATQLYDLTTHPTYPWIMGAGFQDNGSWVSYGGTSWMLCSVADGGAVAFQPNHTDTFLTTTQESVGQSQVSFESMPSLRPSGLGDFGSVEGVPPRHVWNARLGTRLPDRPMVDVAGTPQFPMSIFVKRELVSEFNPGGDSLFGHKIAGHPVRQDSFIAGEQNAAYITNGGTIDGVMPSLTWNKIENPVGGDAITFAGEVSAIAYAPTFPAVAPSPNSDSNMWVGTADGHLYMTRDGGTNWRDLTDRVKDFWRSGVDPTTFNLPRINDIAVHPTNPNIVAIAMNSSGRSVLITANARGANPRWRSVSHIANNAANRLPTCSATRVVFDADRSLANGARDPQTLFVATLAGIFVSRTVRAGGTSRPNWQSFNTNLPLLLVRDLEYAESHEDNGDIRRRFLRIGTYGRGVYECDLATAGVPAARLMIRTSAIDDSYDYIASETVTHDPRLNVPGQPTEPLDLAHAIDIRIDPPPYEVFGDTLDAVEFDEDLRSGTLVLGEPNFIYVQVHNRGHEELSDVDVHLYFAQAPGTPPIAPNLKPSFWDSFPDPQDAGDAWQIAGTDRQSKLHSGQPRVFRIEWTPPLTLGDNVALLAIATHPSDTLAGLASADQPTRAVHPINLPNSLTVSERRAALYITPTRRVTPDIYVRDGLDDTGQPGAVAWGGRGADIIVTDAVVVDPDATFDDVTDLRPDDRVRGGQDNHIYVRAFNRSNAAQTIDVDVFAVPYATLTDASTWVQIGATQQIADVPAGETRFTGGLTWASADINDPAPGIDHKAYLLVALIGSGEDPRPDPAAIATLAEFWAFFRSAENANNASFRALPFLP